MKLITEIEFIRPFPLVLDCRLYAMEPGDRLTVQESSRDHRGDIPPALAKELILRRYVTVPGGLLEEEGNHE